MRVDFTECLSFVLSVIPFRADHERDYNRARDRTFQRRSHKRFARLVYGI